ncbi:MAG: hypothetical protein H6Q59_2542, partial [Firmicutes bacterium]|nr:hypothetical protein [Bacillota bacterium]
MLIITIAVLLSVVGLYLYSLRRPREWLAELDKKEHKLYFLYPMAEMILSESVLHKLLQSDREITDSIKALKVTSKPEKEQRLYEYSKVALVIAVLSLFAVLSFFAMLDGQSAMLLKDGSYLTRPEYGEGSNRARLDVTLEGTAPKEGGKKDDKLTKQITLEIAERIYTDEELDQLFEQGKEYILDHVLESNERLEEIDQNLNFCKTIPDTGITVTWEPEDNTLIQSDGTVLNGELTIEQKTSVTATLSYGERRTNLCIYLKILPRRYSEEEKLNQNLSEELKKADQSSKHERHFKLPINLDDYRLTWREETNSTGGTFVILGILLAVVLWYARDYEIKNQMKRRKEQLLIDYPE